MSDAAPPSEEPKTPRSPRDWRYLLTELVIVVVGVGLALAAQQTVEWLRWQSEVKAARKAIHAEMSFNNNAFFARYNALASCLEKQTGEAVRILDDLEAGRPASSFTVFQSGSGTTLRDSEWQSEREAQTLTHFPRAELALMGNYYGQLGNFSDWMRQEADAWRALSVLRRPPKNIPASDLLRLRTAVEVVKNAQWLTVLNARRQLRVSRQLGIAIAPVDPARVEKFCTSNVEDYRLYVNAMEQRPR